jgi:hypothetical protein
MHVKRLSRFPRRLTRKLKISHPLQEIGKRNPGFQTCQRRAQTGVDAVPEGATDFGGFS